MKLTPKSLEAMPLETRLLRYHEISEDLMRRATLTPEETEREHLLKLAEEWLALATATESLLREMYPNAQLGL